MIDLNKRLPSNRTLPYWIYPGVLRVAISSSFVAGRKYTNSVLLMVE